MKIFSRITFFLLFFYFNLSSIDETIIKKFFESVRSANFNEAFNLLEKNQDLANTNFDGRYPLHVAFLTDEWQMVELLLQFNAEKYSQDIFGLFPIDYLVCNGKIMNGTEGSSPLFKAVFENKIDDLKKLINERVDINAVSPFEKTALYYAVRKNLPDVVRLLIENGANIDFKDKHKDTLLHTATQYNAVDSIKILLLHKPELINEKNEKGNTPLHIAALFEQPQAAELLLKNGADVTLKNKLGETATQIVEGLKQARNTRKALEQNLHEFSQSLNALAQKI